MTSVGPTPGQGNPPPPYTTVVVAQPMFGGPQPGSTCHYRDSPCLIVCQHCNATVTTSTDYSGGTLPWIIAALICLVGCWLGCCLIPFCISSLKDVTHTCPNCHNTVGRYSRI